MKSPALPLILILSALYLSFCFVLGFIIWLSNKIRKGYDRFLVKHPMVYQFTVTVENNIQEIFEWTKSLLTRF